MCVFPKGGRHIKLFRGHVLYQCYSIVFYMYVYMYMFLAQEGPEMDYVEGGKIWL